ncbi:MAG: hypothetical protein ACOXZM_08330 [Eubacteriales bacterium]|jgi:hypothetical protein
MHTLTFLLYTIFSVCQAFFQGFSVRIPKTSPGHPVYYANDFPRDAYIPNALRAAYAAASMVPMRLAADAADRRLCKITAEKTNNRAEFAYVTVANPRGLCYTT